MRLRLPLLLLLLCPLVAVGSEGSAPLGTITATTTKNNSDTAVPFTLNKGARIAIQCDTAAYVTTGTTSAVTAATTTGVKLAADVLFDIPLRSTEQYVAVVAVSGTSVCKVFAVSP